MPSWDWDAETAFLDSPAGRYQEMHERAERERRVDGWTVPDGWVRPSEPVCPRCWYLLVDGDCVNGHVASLSGRGLASLSGYGRVPEQNDRPPRPESDAKEAA